MDCGRQIWVLALELDQFGDGIFELPSSSGCAVDVSAVDPILLRELTLQISIDSPLSFTSRSMGFNAEAVFFLLFLYFVSLFQL